MDVRPRFYFIVNYNGNLEVNIKYKFPSKFVDRLEKDFPCNFKEILGGLSAVKKHTFRINTNRISIKEFLEKRYDDGMFEYMDIWGGVFALKDMNLRSFQNTDMYRNGEVYIQDISSMSPPHLMELSGSDIVLDMCAAPGSKTIQISNIMGNIGKIIAVEKVRKRYYKLKSNLGNYFVRNAEVYFGDAVYLLRSVINLKFDKILLDAPCSSEGRFNPSKPKTMAYWSERKVKEMERKQRRLILAAWDSLKNGGIILYSTCTFSLDENELVLDFLTKKREGVFLEPFNLPFRNYISGIPVFGNEQLSRAVRIIPTELTGGFFVAKIKKLAE